MAGDTAAGEEDKLTICRATGLMVVVSGTCNVVTTDGTLAQTNLTGLAAGPNFTQSAVKTV